MASKKLYEKDYGIHYGARRRIWERIFRIKRGREGKVPEERGR